MVGKHVDLKINEDVDRIAFNKDGDGNCLKCEQNGG